MRTVDEIKEEIEKVKTQIFYEQMADFMDFGTYHKLNHRLHELMDELEEVTKNEG